MRDWRKLIDLASAQHGYFRASDAVDFGFPRSALIQASRVESVPGYRGLYRLANFPLDPEDKFVAAFVWSKSAGVVSHGSAIELHGLSDWWHHDEWPITMIFPVSWKRRAIPADLIEPFFVDLEDDQVQWGPSGAYLITTPARTVMDFIDWGVRPDLANQAVFQGHRRGLFRMPEIKNRRKVRDL